jgi:hypothetical protein
MTSSDRGRQARERLVSALRRWTVPALAASLWVVTLLFALRSFAPDRDLVGPFNSDDAISVIMANDTSFTPFHLFLFGQDRFGAWPHLLLALTSHLVGTITPSMFNHLQVLWAWLAAIPLWQLAGPFAPGVLAAYLLALTLPLPLVQTLFAYQPYSWQIGALVWAWWMFRCVAQAERVRLLPVAGACVAAFLATWASRASGPMLVVIAAIESLRARRARSENLATLAVPVPVALASVIAESVLRTVHARYSQLHFGSDFRTSVMLDRGFLRQNLDAAFGRTVAMAPGWLSVAAGALGFGMLVLWVIAHLRRWPRRDWEEVAVLLGGFATVMAAQFSVAVVTTWVRLNDFSPRYFVLIGLFGALVLGTVTSALTWRGGVWAQAVVLGLSLIWFLHEGRPVHAAEHFLRARAAGLALARVEPRAFVWGSYWGTYLLAGAAPEARLRPIPFLSDRMPWLDRDFASSQVVFGSFEYTDRFGTPADAARVVTDRGQVFEFVRSLKADTMPFAMYRRRTADRARLHLEQGSDGAAALFDGRPDTTYWPRELQLRYECTRSSTIDVLGEATSIERWRSQRWQPLTPATPQHWQLPKAAGEVRLRIRSHGPVSELVILCDES